MPKRANASSWQSRPLPVLLHRIGRLGLQIQFFIVTREGANPIEEYPHAEEGLTSAFISEAETPELIRLRPEVDPSIWRERFQRGVLCFALKAGDRVVAVTWCDLEEARHPPVSRRLGPKEAYLLDAYTDPAWRGRNLAPFIRTLCYEALRAQGRDSFFSYTDYFNAPSRRFKSKLGAVEEEVQVHLTLFGRVSRAFTIRRIKAKP